MIEQRLVRAQLLNLDNLDPRCGELDYIVSEGRDLSVDYVMNITTSRSGASTRRSFFKRWS